MLWQGPIAFAIADGFTFPRVILPKTLIRRATRVYLDREAFNEEGDGGMPAGTLPLRRWYTISPQPDPPLIVRLLATGEVRRLRLLNVLGVPTLQRTLKYSQEPTATFPAAQAVATVGAPWSTVPSPGSIVQIRHDPGRWPGVFALVDVPDAEPADLAHLTESEMGPNPEKPLGDPIVLRHRVHRLVLDDAPRRTDLERDSRLLCTRDEVDAITEDTRTGLRYVRLK